MKVVSEIKGYAISYQTALSNLVQIWFWVWFGFVSRECGIFGLRFLGFLLFFQVFWSWSWIMSYASFPYLLVTFNEISIIRKKGKWHIERYSMVYLSKYITFFHIFFLIFFWVKYMESVTYFYGSSTFLAFIIARNINYQSEKILIFNTKHVRSGKTYTVDKIL